MPRPKEVDLEEIHKYNIDLKHNQIYLVGTEDYIGHLDLEEPGVEYSMASSFIKNIHLIMRRNSDPITIHMKTCGGDYHEGMAIYDSIKACPNKINILNYTHARSMSSIIFQAADRRIMMPNSIFMFHEGEVMYEGTPKGLFSITTLEKRSLECMVDIYANAMKLKGKFSTWSIKKIKDWLKKEMAYKEDVYLTAEETVELGLADEIFQGWKKKEVPIGARM